MKLTNLRVNHVSNPIGFSLSPLFFSWNTEDGAEGDGPLHSRVRIFREELPGWAKRRMQDISEGFCEVYDSGMTKKADGLDFSVEIPLLPRTGYRFRVESESRLGYRAAEEGFFETGKLNEPWIGQWISPERRDVAILQKRFFLPEEGEGILPEWARLYVCGLGVYECCLNGKKVGEEFLAPGYHSYDAHLQVQTYPVEGCLQPGENLLEIWLGEGWFKGRLGFDGGYENLYGDRLFAIAELHISGREGKEKVPEQGEKSGRLSRCLLKTDDSWEEASSPVLFSRIYDGEVLDSRVKISPVGPVSLLAPERTGPLGDRYSLPIAAKEVIPVKEVIYTPKKEVVLDFGQNMTGWVEFDLSLPSGRGILLQAGEIMQKGAFYRENLRSARAEFRYISDGKKELVRPRFSFFGFRYMRLIYLDTLGDSILEDTGNWELTEEEMKNGFRAVHLRSDFERTGFLETGHGKVNQLISNILWGQKGNFLDVPTDCPQRDERLGWTGDAQVFSETACYNMYVPAFFRKYLWDMRAEQDRLEGSVPHIVPRIKEGIAGGHGACPWGDAAVIIPWNLYRFFGSRSLLRECFPGMKAWVDFQRKRDEAAGGGYLIQDGFHFADWLALDNAEPGPFGATDPLFIASAYYYRCTHLVAEAAGELGLKEEFAYRSLAASIKEAIEEKYFDEKGICRIRTQTAAAMAIAFGFCEGSKDAQGEVLERMLRENNHLLSTGFVGTPLLCPALTETGRAALAYRLLLNEKYPGWLYAVNLGATTIWERWNSVLFDGSMNPEGMNSLNHYAYGSIGAWMYGVIGGIRPLEAGFKRALLSPLPNRELGFAKCRLKTASGSFESAWRYEANGGLSFDFFIPFGAEGLILLPDGQRIRALSGRHHFEIEEV